VAAVSRQPAVGRPARPGSLLLRLPADTRWCQTCTELIAACPRATRTARPPADRSKPLPARPTRFWWSLRAAKAGVKRWQERSRPTGGLTSGHPAGMAHVKVNQVSSWQEVNNPSSIGLSTGRIPAAPHSYRCWWRSHWLSICCSERCGRGHPGI